MENNYQCSGCLEDPCTCKADEDPCGPDQAGDHGVSRLIGFTSELMELRKKYGVYIYAKAARDFSDAAIVVGCVADGEGTEAFLSVLEDEVS